MSGMDREARAEVLDGSMLPVALCCCCCCCWPSRARIWLRGSEAMGLVFATVGKLDCSDSEPMDGTKDESDT